jgi:formylglycine-generating enzyme required for sulfatase activity
LTEPRPAGVDEIWALGAMHPQPEMRRAAVRLAATRPADPEARRLLAWAVNDVDDQVAVAALSALAAEADLGAVDDVFDAVGRSMAALGGVSSSGCDTRRKLALDALVRLVHAHPESNRLRRRLSETGYDRRQTLPDGPPGAQAMVEIPPGPGIRHTFWIDVHPVTWCDYAEFEAAVDRDGPRWDHPGQPTGHDHHVASRLSPGALERLANHPVVGVTWYDAWAYAAWRGKVLPTVAQWELAAGGPGRTRHPWGDAAPTPDRVHFAADTMDDVLARYGDGSTAAVGTHPAGATPAGVHDLGGNVWEWTRSRALDEQNLYPFAGSVPYADTVGNWAFFACVKGGSWASPAADLDVAVRVGKHVVQRGPETGFRCVFEPYGA